MTGLGRGCLRQHVGDGATFQFRVVERQHQGAAFQAFGTDANAKLCVARREEVSFERTARAEQRDRG
jgi:hypothetical protein